MACFSYDSMSMTKIMFLALDDLQVMNYNPSGFRKFINFFKVSIAYQVLSFLMLKWFVLMKSKKK